MYNFLQYFTIQYKFPTTIDDRNFVISSCSANECIVLIIPVPISVKFVIRSKNSAFVRKTFIFSSRLCLNCRPRVSRLHHKIISKKLIIYLQLIVPLLCICPSLLSLNTNLLKLFFLTAYP